MPKRNKTNSVVLHGVGVGNSPEPRSRRLSQEMCDLEGFSGSWKGSVGAGRLERAEGLDSKDRS